MNLAEFAAAVRAAVDDGRIERVAHRRWAEQTIRLLAEKHVTLALALEELPAELHDGYFEALDEILSQFAPNQIVLVQPHVRDALLAHAPDEQRDAIAAKTVTALRYPGWL